MFLKIILILASPNAYVLVIQSIGRENDMCNIHVYIFHFLDSRASPINQDPCSLSYCIDNCLAAGNLDAAVLFENLNLEMAVLLPLLVSVYIYIYFNGEKERKKDCQGVKITDAAMKIFAFRCFIKAGGAAKSEYILLHST